MNIIWLLQRLDAFVQRHFDYCVHYLMREHGLTKRKIRFFLSFLLLNALAGLITHSFHESKYVDCTMLVIVTCVMSFLVLRDDNDDAKVEESNYTVASKADRRFNIHWFKLFMFFVAISSVVGFFDVEDNWELLIVTSRSVYDLTYLALMYLSKTTPVKPKRKESKVLVAQFA